MKKIFTTIPIVIIALAGCAVSPDRDQYEALRDSFDAWARFQKQKEIEQGGTPGLWIKTELGAYIIEDYEPAEGRLVGSIEDSPMLFVEYRSSDFDGTITETTYEQDAKQLGVHTADRYYGPVIWNRNEKSSIVLFAGLDEAVSTMRVGGRKKIANPSWLATMGRYDTEEEYIKNKKDYTTYGESIYDIHLVDIVDDPEKWQIDSLEEYCQKHYPGLDSTIYGLYYNLEKTGKDFTWKNGDTIKVSFTGRLLNGNVFDTNIRDSAMVYHLYDNSKSYKPLELIWDEDHTKITIVGTDDGTIVKGLSYVVQKMMPGEKGTVLFYYPYGYGTVNQGNVIPSYSSLSFTVEIAN